MVTLVGVILTIGVVAALWRDTEPSQDLAGPTPGTTAQTPIPSQSKPTATVESTRNVSVDGTTVTVEEVSDLVDGVSAVAEPTQGAPLGLRLVDSAVIAPDGRKRAFDAPITLTPSGSLTVRSRYRLTACPDVVPVQWPSPAEFPDATRSYLRLDGPLHTAFALCPKASPKAKQLPQLTGVVVGGGAPAVRLTWKGSDDLIIRAIGSASGVAALATDPECDAGCVATIDSGGSAFVQFQPVDPCPPATTDDSLTLILEVSGRRTSVVAVRVPELHRTVCG